MNVREARRSGAVEPTSELGEMKRVASQLNDILEQPAFPGFNSHRLLPYSVVDNRPHGGVNIGSVDHKRKLMADAKDVAAVIQSALEEIGVKGQLDVSMDGKEVSKTLGTTTGNDQRVEVVVEDLENMAIKHMPE